MKSNIIENNPKALWLNAEEISMYSSDMNTYLAIGGKKEWGRKYFLKLRKLPNLEKYTCILLLKTDRTNPFLYDLRNQLIQWIENDIEYPTPFSSKQWARLFTSTKLK